MRIRLRATLAAAALAVAITTVPTTAHAHTEASPDCPSDWLCGWTDSGYGGVGSFVNQDMASYPQTTAYVGFNDGRSVWNSSGTWAVGNQLWGHCVTVYSAVNYRGNSRTLQPGEGIVTLPASFGHIRSNRFVQCRVA